MGISNTNIVVTTIIVVIIINMITIFSKFRSCKKTVQVKKINTEDEIIASRINLITLLVRTSCLETKEDITSTHKVTNIQLSKFAPRQAGAHNIYSVINGSLISRKGMFVEFESIDPPNLLELHKFAKSYHKLGYKDEYIHYHRAYNPFNFSNTTLFNGWHLGPRCRLIIPEWELLKEVVSESLEYNLNLKGIEHPVVKHIKSVMESSNMSSVDLRTEGKTKFSLGAISFPNYPVLLFTKIMLYVILPILSILILICICSKYCCRPNKTVLTTSVGRNSHRDEPW